MKIKGCILLLFLGLLQVVAQTPVDSLQILVPSRVDTVAKQKVERFELSQDEDIIRIATDTMLTGIHRYNPAWKKYTYPLTLGNIVSPILSAGLSQREPFTDAFFMDPYKPYLPDPEQHYFYRVRQPFTQLTYASGGQKDIKEQQLDVIHTQNVNENLNAGLMLRFPGGEGQYNYQKEIEKYFVFFIGYTGKRYHLFTAFNSIRITRQENGGISDLSLVGVSKPKELPTFLAQANDAQTDIKSKGLTLVQSYALGKYRDSTGSTSDQEIPNAQTWAKIVYTMNYQKDGRSYSDNDPASGFYNNIYIDPLQTYDTSGYRNWEHEISLHLQSNPERKLSVGSVIGASYEMQKYYQNNIPDTVISNLDTIITIHQDQGQYIAAVTPDADTTITLYTEKQINNLALFGEIYNDIGEGFYWKAHGKIYLEGYKAGNTYLGGEMEKRFGRGGNPATWKIYGSIQITRPGYWINHYSSNNFVWDNDFRFEKKITGGTRFAIPAIKFALSGEAVFHDQYIYFDSLAHPVQTGEPFLTYSASVDKTFRWWKISSRNILTLQYSANTDALPVPNVLLQNSTYFHHTFHFAVTGGQMDTQLGFDLYYFTPFDGYAYMPATGLFYVQHKQQTGNYPFINLFLDVKVKRTRIFVKAEHVNAGLMGNNYIMITNYPINPLFLKLGLSWTFYD